VSMCWSACFPDISCYNLEYLRASESIDLFTTSDCVIEADGTRRQQQA